MLLKISQSHTFNKVTCPWKWHFHLERGFSHSWLKSWVMQTLTASIPGRGACNIRMHENREPTGGLAGWYLKHGFDLLKENYFILFVILLTSSSQIWLPDFSLNLRLITETQFLKHVWTWHSLLVTYCTMASCKFLSSLYFLFPVAKTRVFMAI